jgi:biopolymer transport protein ExbD
MFTFAHPQRRRRISLTPMIDVVFLLLVFFMLAARFGAEGAIAMATGGGDEAWQGSPRLIEFASGALWLNGTPTMAPDLAEALRALMPAPGAPVILRPRAGADTQALVDLVALLKSSGFDTVILVEGE